MGAEKMNGNTKYWVWLSLALGAGAKVDEILSAYPDPIKLFEEETADRIISGVFTRRQIEKLEALKLSDAETAIAVCKKNGWSIVTLEDSDYPAGLRKLPDMPLVLYVDGSLECLKGKVIIGVVGTRKPCHESIVIARRISGDLASAGAVVVSGGALGIDSSAHEGAVEAGGKTVCVMGCGLGVNYLMSNEAMRRSIRENGAVISEFPPLSQASRMTFPIRNRIISGMSHGVLVVEAGVKSGSLITARCAAEQGREVFAIPGSVLTTAYSGANNLIRDGAKAVSCAEDILKPYAEMYPDRLRLDAIDRSPIKTEEKVETEKVYKTVKKEIKTGLDPNARAVYNLFGDEPLHPDEICAESGLPLSKVISALMQLEMADLIKQTDGKNYILND